jgi:hypothetical protein
VLFHDTSWQSFIKHYWISFVWLTAAVGTIVIILAGGEQALNSPIIFIPIVAGMFRAFRGGWRPDQELQKGDEGCLVVMLQLAFSILLWPLFEIFRQLRFLVRARQIWAKGEILVNEKNNPVRSA